MSDTDEKGLPKWALPALSWLVSFYFLLGFVANVGFPPDRSLLLGDFIYVFLWLLFLFLPFFSKVKIGHFIELEREMARTKQEVQDFKMEIRNSVAVLSTSINTIGNMTNQITVNIPGVTELQNATQKVDEQSKPTTKEEAEQVQQTMLLDSEDTTMALARTRIKIEGLLRTILGKKPSVNALRNQSIRFSGIRQLFDMFIREYDNYAYLREPLTYVTEVCNAAIHAQKVSYEQANEALRLGARVIAVLSDITGEGDAC
jgi:hypothetical protein